VKITDISTFLVPPRWLFLRIETNEGITGWGEPVVEGRAETVRTAVAELSDLLIGEDPLRIEDHWQVLTRGGFYRGGPVLSSAVAGIDQALWDIAGKTYGAPVHQLLGGPVRDKARVYAWIGGDEPQDVADQAREQVESGFTAVKMNASGRMEPIETLAATRAIVGRVAAVRDAIGPDRDLVVDFHGRMSTAMSRRLLPLLEPLSPLFVEEPALPEYSSDLARLVEHTTVPLATGERLYSRWDFRDVLTSGIAVVQPDVSHAGGISEVRRIAALAEAHDVTLAPHCPLGPIALAASLQLAFATPNFPHRGAEHRPALQPAERAAGLPDRAGNLPVRERLRGAAGRSRARHRDRRVRGAPRR
jgi:galactonate dehydratase